MTNEQKYTELLKEIGAIIKEKNETISFQVSYISLLEEKLAKAEKENERLKGE